MKKLCHSMKFGGILLLLSLGSCKEPYNPPLIRANPNYLVVNGFINSGNDSTIITLSRTRNLGDSVPPVPELNAQVEVLGENGEVFFLQELGNGIYAAPALNLHANEKYRLQILSASNSKYLSDPVPVTPTPPIDSISWREDSLVANRPGVTIFANTHDPNNNTWYYRWEYDETWEYHSAFESFYFYDGTAVVARNPGDFRYACWRSQPSTGIILASSAKLSQDLIFENPINFIPIGDQKLSVRYSILVKQYAMSREAYEYWENLKKNTELTGSLFDPQPSQVKGNIRNVTNPSEPVLGYISASSVQEQRIFIENSSLEHWGYVNALGCTEKMIPIDSVDYYFKSQLYVPISEYINFPNVGYYAALPSCVDCTLQSGTTIKPIYW